ncbi:MAG: ribonuclease P protein component [Candidatus Brocadia sp.]|uniref:Ribonuclease P protein component n=1 Tax=Candidatus Brocadia fulgida TaxID=380242 RepID=A0A0M2UYL8_9BACT|nr:MAG: ribonuclease [Candidatus Brocadia fulgida]UJS22434.1 MAG: ribonuclease P protein component [Candidatus Brocadia sp.]
MVFVVFVVELFWLRLCCLMNFRFTKAERLTLKKEFERVFQDGKVLKDAKVVLYVMANSLPHSRLGLVVSKKVGNAVRRNRAKRLLREVYRLNKHVLTMHVDMIAIPRHPFSSDLKRSDVEDGFKKLLLKINEAFCP